MMQMRYELKSELRKIEIKERRWLQKKDSYGALKEKLYEKVPPALDKTLQAAFEKAFGLLFLKGRGLVELTFNKKQLEREFRGRDILAEKTMDLKHLKSVEKRLNHSQRVNNFVTTLSGVGMGLVGMGLPDIPMFAATVLKGVYEIAAGYGIDYTQPDEQVYILRLIRAALVDGDERVRLSQALDSPAEEGTEVSEEIALTSEALADALLVEKFVQSVPIVGAVGGIVNNRVYARISALAGMKYKKRYLLSKMM